MPTRHQEDHRAFITHELAAFAPNLPQFARQGTLHFGNIGEEETQQDELRLRRDIAKTNGSASAHRKRGLGH